MSLTEHLHLFAGYGIEMEYMIVDRETLAVRPISDQLLAEATRLPGATFEEPYEGVAPGEVAHGKMAWSNELVMHVIEIKTNGPTADLAGLDLAFQQEIQRINSLLAPHQAMLLPTAMHPFFDPDRETKLWIHDNAEIYAAYDRIFGCRGHGWSNLQSVHINLPFYDDDEFGRLHAAVRLVLPILPALAASSPIYEGKASGLMDSRLEFYRGNQRAVPLITGDVIPEPAFTHAEYGEKIWQPIYDAIRPHDPQGLLQDEWLNSRGAIARFQRHAIEIRVLDIQESPRADAAVISAVVSLVRALVDQRWLSTADQMRWLAKPLRSIFEACVRQGGDAVIEDLAYLQMFGVKSARITANELWRCLCDDLAASAQYPLASRNADVQFILERGCLAKRILRAVGPSPDRAKIRSVYLKLAQHLANGELFDGV